MAVSNLFSEVFTAAGYRPGFTKPVEARVNKHSSTCCLPLIIDAPNNESPPLNCYANLKVGRKELEVWVSKSDLISGTTMDKGNFEDVLRSVCTGQAMSLKQGTTVVLCPLPIETLLQRGNRLIQKIIDLGFDALTTAEHHQLYKVLCSLDPFENEARVSQFVQNLAIAVGALVPIFVVRSKIAQMV